MTESYELRKRGVSVMFAKKGRRCTIQFDTPRPEVCLCLSKLDFLVNLVVSRSFQKVSFLAHSVASLKEFVSKTSKHYSGFTYEDGIFMAKTIASLKQEGSAYAAPMSSIRLTLAVVLFFPIVFAFWQGNSSLLTVMQYYQGLSVVMVFTVLWGLFYGFFRSSFGYPFPTFSNWTYIGLSFSIIQAIIFLQIR